MEIKLSQRTRAALQFLGTSQSYAGSVLQARAGAEYERSVVHPPLSLAERKESVEGALADSAAWKFDRLLTRWVAEEVYVHALPGIEEIREDVEGFLDRPAAVGSLTLDPQLVPPAYWEEGFHLTPGGWDGHDLMGPAVDELVYAYVLTPGGVGAVKTGENLHDQRTLVAMEAPQDSYRHIVELGSGTGRFTRPLRRTYPEAKLTAVELSTSSLKYGHALAAEAGFDIDWVQAAAENTGLTDNSADLVAFYTLMHEVPTNFNQEILQEAFRILEPGGDLLIGEVAPYDQQTAFRAVVLDWETENRGEPYWRDALSMDLAGMLDAAGFTEVKAYGLGESLYPWVTRARKPF